jgi:hypothetical protein
MGEDQTEVIIPVLAEHKKAVRNISAFSKEAKRKKEDAQIREALHTCRHVFGHFTHLRSENSQQIADGILDQPRREDVPGGLTLRTILSKVTELTPGSIDWDTRFKAYDSIAYKGGPGGQPGDTVVTQIDARDNGTTFWVRSLNNEGNMINTTVTVPIDKNDPHLTSVLVGESATDDENFDRPVPLSMTGFRVSWPGGSERSEISTTTHKRDWENGIRTLTTTTVANELK